VEWNSQDSVYPNPIVVNPPDFGWLYILHGSPIFNFMFMNELAAGPWSGIHRIQHTPTQKAEGYWAVGKRFQI
jgi:hypothetical protein